MSNTERRTFRCSECGKLVTLTVFIGEVEKGFWMTCFNRCKMKVCKETEVAG